MKTIKIKFLDYYPGHKPEENLIYRILTKHYQVELSETPDYIIDGGLGHAHLDPKYAQCVKLVAIGENIAPDFNCFDYAIAFDDLTFGDRYLRLPLFAFYQAFADLAERKAASDDELWNRKFCSFIVSDTKGDPCRVEFFKELSKYRQVDSGGGVLNNVGGRVASKCGFCSQYKFNIAFENSVHPGYTTEKIMEPLSVNSVPIYYGDPNVTADFTEACMVRLHSREEMQKAIDEIIYLDTHKEAYLAKCRASCLVHPVSWYEAQLTDFLMHIFDQPLEKAHRLAAFGNQVMYRNRHYRLHRVDDLYRVPLLKLMGFCRRVKRLVVSG